MRAKVYGMPPNIKRILTFINNHGEKIAREKFGDNKIDYVIRNWLYLD